MGKLNEDFRRKKNRNIILDLLKNPVVYTATKKQQMNMALVNSNNQTQQNLRGPSFQNCWKFARLELRIQVLACSDFM